MDVSVVIPLYNKARHVQRALDSVLAQTRKDFEVIVVNDGSTDGSEKVVESYTDPRIRLVHREHINSAGGHAARNRGIAEARAELIAFLDADDEWLPGHLATIMRLADRHPECGAYATAFRVITPGGKMTNAAYTGIPAPPFEGVIPSYFRTVWGDQAVWTSAVAIPRRAFEACGLFPEGEPRRGDLDMWCRIALKFPIAFSTDVSAVYHREADNRVRNGRPVVSEPRIVRTLEGALAGEDLPANVARSDLLAYMSMQLISRAQSIAHYGYIREARELLRKVAPTRGGPGTFRRWVFLSHLPLPLVGLGIRAAQLLDGMCSGAGRAIRRRE